MRPGHRESRPEVRSQTVISSSEPRGIVRGGVAPDVVEALGCGGAGGAAACCVLNARTGWARGTGEIGAAVLATPASVVGGNMPATLSANGKQTLNQTTSVSETSRSIRAASARSASTSATTAADSVKVSLSRAAANIIRNRVSRAAMP